MQIRGCDVDQARQGTGAGLADEVKVEFAKTAVAQVLGDEGK